MVCSAFSSAGAWWKFNESGLVPGAVTKLRASDGANLGAFPVGSYPYGVAFDGSSIWVANRYSGSVTKLRASDGANLGAFPVGSSPLGVAFDGSSIWVTNQNSGTVSKL